MKKVTIWVLLALLIPWITSYKKSTSAPDKRTSPETRHEIQKAIGIANAAVYGFTGNDSLAGSVCVR